MRVGKVIKLKDYNTEEDRINIFVRLIRKDLNKLNRILKTESLTPEEVCVLAEELCRYEKIDSLNIILEKHSEVLYYYHCDILDIAVGTCNIDLLKMILSKYDVDYNPSIKYEGSCHRAVENKRKDVLELLREHNVNII